MSKQLLLHENRPVLLFEADDTSGYIKQVLETYDLTEAPVGICCNDRLIPENLRSWWRNRALPIERDRVAKVLQRLNIVAPSALVLRCNGFSLSDTYWVREENSEITWESGNFFENDFSSDLGQLLFSGDVLPKDLRSPDATSGGFLEKKWILRDNQRLLLKKGSHFLQQPFNEELVSKICSHLDIPHTPYWVEQHDDTVVSVCPCFTDGTQDEVTAYWLMHTQKQPNHLSRYQYYQQLCKDAGVDIQNAMDKMLVIDFLTLNEDRHLNNFGLLRDAEGLTYNNPVPLFDNGSSFGYRKPLSALAGSGFQDACKPFKKNQISQLELVSDLSWLNKQSLQDLPQIAEQVFSTDLARDFGMAERAEKIVASLETRCRFLQSYEPQHTKDSRDTDTFALAPDMYQDARAEVVKKTSDRTCKR